MAALGQGLGILYVLFLILRSTLYGILILDTEF